MPELILKVKINKGADLGKRNNRPDKNNRNKKAQLRIKRMLRDDLNRIFSRKNKPANKQ